jgi:hypothetical protein
MTLQGQFPGHLATSSLHSVEPLTTQSLNCAETVKKQHTAASAPQAKPTTAPGDDEVPAADEEGKLAEARTKCAVLGEYHDKMSLNILIDSYTFLSEYSKCLVYCCRIQLSSSKVPTRP